MPKRFRDFDAAAEQREPVEFQVKGRRYSLPGDPPMPIVARLIGANAEGGLNVELAAARVEVAKAELALLNASPDDAAEVATANEAVAAAREAVKPLQDEMNRLIVDLLGKDQADRMIADGVGFYTYNKILRWIQFAYGLAPDPDAEDGGITEEAARNLLTTMREIAEKQNKPALLAMLDAADAAFGEAVKAEENGAPKAPGHRGAPRTKKMPADHQRPRSTSRTSSRGTP